MTYCAQCGKELNSGARFCSFCGTPVKQGEPTERKQEYTGTIKKCPNCGEILKAFQSVCPLCGHEIREAKASAAVRDFSERLMLLESRRKSKSKFSNFTSSIGLGKKDNTDEQINNLIRTYAIPNTKEDVYEFMILASSNINPIVFLTDDPKKAGVNDSKELSAAVAKTQSWLAKVDQVYKKAQISFSTDPEFRKIQAIYDETVVRVSEAKAQSKKRKTLIIGSAICGFALVFAIPFIMMSIENHKYNAKEAELESIVIEIQENIAIGNYDAALIKANSLYMDDSYSSDGAKHWDEEREYLIGMIETAKEEADK